MCLCASPWYGADCTQVDKQALCEPTCKNGGECTQTTDENNHLKGVCVCQSGFIGSDCGSKGCPNKCNGHGICKVTTNEAGKAKGKCYCENGFAGKGCNARYAHILHVVNATMLEDAYKAPVCVEKVSSVVHVRKDAAL